MENIFFINKRLLVLRSLLLVMAAVFYTNTVLAESENVKMKVGDITTLKIPDKYLKDYPYCGSSSTWQSSNSTYVSILWNSGTTAKVEAKQATTSPIIVHCYYDYSILTSGNVLREGSTYYDFYITVSESDDNEEGLVTEINVGPSQLFLYAGNEWPLTYEVKPDNAKNKSVAWSSSDDRIAYVSSSGKVTAKKEGQATIFCTAKDGSGVEGTCLVKVKDSIFVSSVSLPEERAVAVGDSLQLNATVLPDNATDKTIVWSVPWYNTIASVTKTGMVYGKRTGTITVTAKAHNGKSAKCKVTVSDPVFKDCMTEDFCMTYRVLNYTDSICQVGEYLDNQNMPAIDENYDYDLVIPSSCNGFKVQRIGAGAFHNCMIRSVEIPSSVKYIEDGAFQGCSNLWKVTINGLYMMSVANNAFEGVGSEDNPCIIKAPSLFKFGVDDTSGSCFKWKGGYFVLEKNYKPDKKYGYAELSKDLTTLTFYCDDAWNQKDGIVFNLNKDGEVPEWLNYGNTITNVFFDVSFAEAKPRTAYRWFYGLSKLTSVSFGESRLGSIYYDLSGITSTQEMFANCTSLQYVDLSPIQESWRLINASSMFKNCSSLENVVLYNVHKTCSCCQDEIALDIDLIIPTDISYMFSGCERLEKVPNSSIFLKGTISDATSLFQGCSSLHHADLHHIIFSSEIGSEHFFAGCTGLRYVLLGSSAFHIANGAFEDVGQVDGPCGIYIPEGTNLGVSTSADSFYFRNGCFTTKTPLAYAMLYDKRLTFYYDNKMLDRAGSMYLIDNGPRWNDDSYHEYKTVSFDETFKNYKPTSLLGWFWGQHSLEGFEKMEYLNTSEVTNMAYLFGGYHYTCVGIFSNNFMSLDLSHFDTSKVTNMEGMFQGCGNLTSLDLSHFDTSRVTDMSYMFDGCRSLTDIDVSHFNTSNVTNMEGMFQGCSGLKKLDVNNFNTSKVESSGKMFSVGISDEDEVLYPGEETPRPALKTLVLSPTMADLSDDACFGVGCIISNEFDPVTEEVYLTTQFDSPVDIHTPKGFDFRTGTSGGAFVWKGGYFHLVSGIAYANSFSVKPGESADLTISLENGDDEVSGYEFVLLMPEGVELSNNGGGYEYTLSDRYSKEGMRVSIANPSPGEYRLTVFSLNKVTLTGKDGPIITLVLESDGQLSEGSYTVTLKDFVCYNTDGENLDVTELDVPIYVTSFSPGDVNHDGSLNVVDVMLVVNSILGTDNETYHPENSDMDANGIVNVADVTRIVDAIQSQPIKTAPAPAKNTKF